MPSSSSTPRAWFAPAPAASLLVFRFGSDQPGATFLCKVDRAPFARLRAHFARRYGLGGHVLKVKARGSSGLSTRPRPSSASGSSRG